MASSGVQLKPLDIMRFLLHRGPLILVLGCLLFIGIMPLLLTRVQPKYRAETHLMLTPVKQPTLQGRDRDAIPGDLRDYMRTLSMRIMSYNILHKALESLPKNEWPIFLKKDDSMTRNVFRLMGRMEARELPGTYLLEISIEAGDPKGLGLAINAVTETYLRQLEKEQERQYARRLSYLTEERDRIMRNITEQREKLVALADKAGQRAFLHKAYEAHLNKLQLLQKYYWEAEADRLDKQSELDKILMQNKEIEALSLDPFADRRVADNFGINRMEQWTYEKLQELRSSIDGLTPSNPERQYVEMRMQAMEEYLRGYKANVRSNTVIMLTAERFHQMEADRIQAESSARAAQLAVHSLREQKLAAEQEASAISDVIFSAQELIFNIDQLQTRLAALDSRIDDDQIQAKAPLPVHVDRKAVTPESPYETNQKKLMAIAFIFSFGFVGAVCVLFDLLDNRVRSRQEVEKLLGGMIPEPVPLVSHEDICMDLVVQDHPSHPAAGALRKLAVRLYPEKHRNGAKVFCLSGTEDTCGVSTICSNLAACIKAYDERVLVVELNMSRPSSFWSSYSMQNNTEKALSDLKDVQNMIFHHEASGIDVLPAGRHHDEIMPVSHLRMLLDQVLDQYDWVLLDCAPLLDDDLAQFSAQQADGVLIVAKEDQSYYQRLASAKKLLEYYQVPAMTVVLNGARREPGEWLFASIQSSLFLMSWLHRKIQMTTRSFSKKENK